MIHGKRVVVVLPAYNAEKTLRKTAEEIPRDIADDVILVDDASSDHTVELAREMGLHTVVHPKNRGYGANQKTCYREALRRDAEVVVMLHPDYQYSPKLLTAMASLVAIGQYDVVLGSRILSEGIIEGGMPRYKYFANRVLTLTQNLLLRRKLSEYHTGYRAFSRETLETLPLEENSDDFVFDNQILCQALYFGFRIGEISCPVRYFAEASSIGFRRSVEYGFGVLATSFEYRFNKWGMRQSLRFSAEGRRLDWQSDV
jgi:glycosyltransferase involved in cell wall biosynthesis